MKSNIHGLSGFVCLEILRIFGLTIMIGIIKSSLCRDVAQPGSAPEWGSGGRWFKSSRPDQ